MPKKKVFGAGVPVNEKTTFSVNFKNAGEILESINPLFSGSKMIQSQLLILALGIIARVDPSNFELVDKLELLRITEHVAKTGFEDFPSVNFQIIRFTDLFLSYCKPATFSLNSSLIKNFLAFFTQVEEKEQVPVYEKLGNLLNQGFFKQSCSFPAVKDLDLVSLIKFSTETIYNETDARFKALIEEATRMSFKYREKTKEAIAHQKNSLYNIVENVLKARNQKCVTPSGLSLLTLVYIFGGRSKLICNMFSSTGAKGTYNLVHDQILSNSKETSYKSCIDGVEVYYSFDNIQKLFAIHRLYSQNQNKAIARVATSVVKCYPDGLIRSSIQYLLENNPMKWLHTISIQKDKLEITEDLDKNVLQSMIKIRDEDMAIVLGRWDFDIQQAIEEVSKEVNDHGKDFIDELIDAEKKSKGRMCLNKHLNENCRGNQKYCRVCGETFIDNVASDDFPKTEEDFENDDNLSSVTIDNSSIPQSVFITPMDKKDKSKLFPKIRNHLNPNQPVYESEGCLYVNPNTFDRLVMVFEEIQKKTGTFENYTSSITVNDDDTLTVESWEITNVRSYILITVDGLPHKMAIDVLKHCYKCKECDRKINSLHDLNSHMKKYKHKTFFKRFSNIILKIGGLHLHMNMQRSFVSLNWNIDYSFICSSIGFQSPKAQLYQQKVQEMHKCLDTFNARRFAKIREYARKYVQSVKNKGKEEVLTAENFENWLKSEVKSKNFKLNVEIDKMYGTSLWLCLAAQRANYWKLFRAAVRVFSGLFHSNGNSFYSVIEIYDDKNGKWKQDFA